MEEEPVSEAQQPASEEDVTETTAAEESFSAEEMAGEPASEEPSESLNDETPAASVQEPASAADEAVLSFEEEEELFVVDGGIEVPENDENAYVQASESTVPEEAEETETETEEETEEEETEEELEVEEQVLDIGLNVSYSCSMGTLGGFPQGNTIYLFLPSNVSGKVTFQYSGGIRSLSAGSISGNKITVDFKGSALTLTAVLTDGSTVYIKLMKSSVPSMNILLNGTTLARIHQNKNIKYPGNTVHIVSGKNPGWNLSVGNVEMKGRGNSSWNRYDKKGYQIKFSSKTSVLGMPAAKKWILVPSAGDGSLMRNKIAYELAGQAGSVFTTEGKYVDLWVSGEYRGLYLLTEKVEIGSNRLNLKNDKGVLIELDNLMYYEEPVVYRSPVSQNVYVLKEAVNESNNAGFNSFCSAMVSFETNLVNKAAWSTITRQIDARSFADWYIVNEFLLNKEDLYTSFFLYKDGDADVIHAGPIWDFDTCEGIYGENNSEYFIESIATPNTRYSDLFHLLGKYLEFVDLVNEVYNEKYRSVAPEIISSITTMYNEISPSANMNYSKFAGTLGATTWKGNTVLPTFKANVDTLKNWLSGRYSLFIPYNFYTRLYTAGGNQRRAVISDDNNVLAGARVAVWSTAGGQDDVRWYNASKSGSTWVAAFDIGAHPGGSEYVMHVYATYKSGADRFIFPMTFYSYTALPGYSAGIRNSTATSGNYVSTRNGTSAYALVFNADYYAKKYPDVVKSVGSKPADLLNYFLKTGMSKQHQGSANFNVTIYKQNYADLQKAFGNNWPAYYTHYIQFGNSEGRNAASLIKSTTPTSGSSGTSTVTKPSGSTSSGTGKSPAAANLDTNFKPVYGGVDYSLVFSAQQYYDRYPDLQKAIGKNAQALLAHFVNNGMKEARIAKSTFDVKLYRVRYADLQKAFGTNWPAYFMHYINNGYKEKRTASTAAPASSGTSSSGTASSGSQAGSKSPASSGTGSSTAQATGISLVFNAKYYLSRYADLKAAFGSDEAKALAHFKNFGMKEGRQGIASFNPLSYRSRYADLQKAFGMNWPAYYNHYMDCGAKEGRIGN